MLAISNTKKTQTGKNIHNFCEHTHTIHLSSLLLWAHSSVYQCSAHGTSIPPTDLNSFALLYNMPTTVHVVPSFLFLVKVKLMNKTWSTFPFTWEWNRHTEKESPRYIRFSPYYATKCVHKKGKQFNHHFPYNFIISFFCFFLLLETLFNMDKIEKNKEHIMHAYIHTQLMQKLGSISNIISIFLFHNLFRFFFLLWYIFFSG